MKNYYQFLYLKKSEKSKFWTVKAGQKTKDVDICFCAAQIPLCGQTPFIQSFHGQSAHQ